MRRKGKSKGGPKTAEQLARYRRQASVRMPLSLGVATMANRRPELAAVREGRAVSVLSPGAVPGEQMRRLAFASPGALFGGDVPVRWVPLDVWGEEEWRSFFKAAGWSAEGAAEMARGARPGEFSARRERVVMASPRERYDQHHDGITARVQEQMELGFTGGVEELAGILKEESGRVMRAMNRLKSRGVVLSDNCRPASYRLNRLQKRRAA